MKRIIISVFLMVFIFFGCNSPVDMGSDMSEIESKNNLLMSMPVKAGVNVVNGEIGPGAYYLLSAPENWNGNLVLYAHGYVSPESPIQLPEIEPLRDFLLSQGYGVAYSSYSENGWAVKDALIRTRQLIGLFKSNFGKPKNTYIIGHSLGGFVALMFAEKNPNLIERILSVCGLVSGAKAQVDHILHVRVLFDYYYPGVIPGTIIDIPEGLNIEQVLLNIQNAIIMNIPSAIELAAVDQAYISYTTIEELIESIVSAIAFDLVGMVDFLDRTHNHSMLDNSDTIYAISGIPVPYLNDLENGVGVIVQHLMQKNILSITINLPGELNIPLMTLHTTRDPQVPFFHEAAYKEIVAGKGCSDFLVQRAFDRFGHCFPVTSAELFGSFFELVMWVETGVKPIEWLIP